MEGFSEFRPGICCYHVWRRLFDASERCDECGATCRRDGDGRIALYARPAAGIKAVNR